MRRPDVSELWQRYVQDRAIDDRNALVDHYDAIARSAALRLAPAFAHIPRDDLLQCARLGLIDAVEKFDPNRGVRFETYAPPRVAGDVVDELRKTDWIPRTIGIRAGAVAKAVSTLENRLGRHPTKAEVAEEMEITEERLEMILKEAAEVTLEYLDRNLGPDHTHAEDLTLGDTIHSGPATPETLFDVEEIRERMAQGLGRLSEQHRVLLALTWREGLTLEAVASLLGIRTTRASQLRTDALLALRAAIAGGVVSTHLGGS